MGKSAHLSHQPLVFLGTLSIHSKTTGSHSECPIHIIYVTASYTKYYIILLYMGLSEELGTSASNGKSKNMFHQHGNDMVIFGVAH